MINEPMTNEPMTNKLITNDQRPILTPFRNKNNIFCQNKTYMAMLAIYGDYCGNDYKRIR
ncbi:hypothetical protein GCM10022289_17600 [Pedobacter jeongneungensis]|uniref:Uncharacterized protein n=1 Tax=Pedobacter jeongneungensis TaxID=947309 RepID=A0ABP8BB78_9SPHI